MDVTSTTADAAAATADAAGAATDKVLAQLTELQASVAKLSTQGGKAVPSSDPTHSKLQKQGTLFKVSPIGAPHGINVVTFTIFLCIYLFR